MSIHNNTLKLEGLKAIAKALPDFTHGEYSVENNDAGGQTYDISIDTNNPLEKFFDADTTDAETISLPNMTSLKEYAFYKFKSPAKILYCPKLRYIGYSSFTESDVEFTELPNSVETIYSNAFYKCKNLKLTKLPDNLRIIRSNAFASCVKLQITILPDGLNLVDDYAFDSSTVDLTEIPASVETIGNMAFSLCSKLKSIRFKGKPSSIAFNAFNMCTNLISIKVPWSEGEVANAPWGATNAVITYNYTGE